MNKSNGEVVSILNKPKNNVLNNVNVELTVLVSQGLIQKQVHVLAHNVPRIADVMHNALAEKNPLKNKELRKQNYPINHKNN